MNHTEARILSLVNQHLGKVSQDEIGQRMTIDRSNVGRAVKSLESREFVRRCRSEEDRRAFIIELTESGREQVTKIAEIKSQIVEAFFNDMTEDEASVIYGLIKKLR